jgi:hypothetical protein
MTSPDDTPLRRLKAYFGNSAPKVIDELTRKLPSDWQESVLGFGSVAYLALRLDPTVAPDAVVIKAFEAAKLDYRNPFHWRFLVTHLSSSHYGRLKAGRKESGAGTWPIAAGAEGMFGIKSREDAGSMQKVMNQGVDRNHAAANG